MATVKTQLVIDGKNNSKKAFDEVNSQLDGMNSRIAAAGKALVGVFSAGALAGAVRGISNATGAWAEMTDRIKLATKSDKEYQESLDSLRKISDRTFTSMANNAEAFISSLTPLRERGFSTREALQFTEALGLGLVASAAKGEKAASVINQFSNALQDGVLRGDAFNSMIRNTPALADAMARGLGKSREELARMAKEGKLTTDVFVPALISQMDSLGGAVDGMQVTVADALTKLDNAWQEAIGQADVKPLVDAIDELGKTLSDPVVMDNLIKLASALATLAGTAVEGASEFVDLGKRIAFVAANASGMVTELDKVDQQIADLDRSLQGKGLSTTIDGLLFSPEELQAKKDALVAFRAAIVEQQTGMNAEMQVLADLAAEAAEAAQQKELSSKRSYVDQLKTQQDQMVQAAEQGGKRLVAAEQKASADLKKIRDDRLAIEKRYQEALAGMNAGGEASYGAAQALKVGARQALRAGDVEGAQAKAQAALKMLQDLQAAGANTYGFAGFVGELRDIELAANDIEKGRAEEKIKAIKDEMRQLKEQALDLKDMPVSVEMDEAALARVQAALDALAKREIIIKVGAQYDFENEYTLQDPGPAPQKYATGGLIRGPGTGTSDSIPALLSNGEYVIRAAAVRKLGKNALDLLNRGIPIPRFADGGMVGTVASLDTSPRNLGSLDISIGGDTYQVFADSTQADQLRLAARKHGRTHRS